MKALREPGSPAHEGIVSPMRVSKAIQTYYQDVHPEYEDIRVSDLAQVAEGMECEIYSFKLCFSRSGQPKEMDRILRIYQVPAQDMGWLSRRHKREYLGLRWLQKRRYPVPAHVELVEDLRYLGKPFLIMQRFAGTSIGETYRHMSPPERVHILRRFCGLYSDLHSLPYKDFAGGHYRSIGEEIEELANLSLELEQHGFTPGWEWLMKRRPSTTSPAIVHGDFHPENVLVSPGGDLCVIDWTQVRVTDYRFDLGWTLLLGDAAGLRETLLRGYEEARQATVPNIAYFEAASALKRLLIFALILQYGPGIVGLRPGADRKIVESMAGHVHALYSKWSTITGCHLEGINQHFPHPIQ